MIIVVDSYEGQEALKLLEEARITHSSYKSFGEAYVHTALEDAISVNPNYENYSDDFIQELMCKIGNDELLPKRLDEVLEQEALNWVSECNNYNIEDE